MKTFPLFGVWFRRRIAVQSLCPCHPSVAPEKIHRIPLPTQCSGDFGGAIIDIIYFFRRVGKVGLAGRVGRVSGANADGVGGLRLLRALAPPPPPNPSPPLASLAG